MLGDSAVTFRLGNSYYSKDGAAKIHYSQESNIGFAIWGNAQVMGRQIDQWLDDFIKNLDKTSKIDFVAERLATSIRLELEQENKTWGEKLFGIHVAGYKDDLPRLWHIHCQHPHEVPHEPRLYRDYPDDQQWSETQFKSMIVDPKFFCQIRNGYIPHYALLFKSINDYANSLRETTNIDFPKNSIEGRLSFHTIMVQFVAGVLEAAGEPPTVNKKISSVAFNENGILIDERVELNNWLEEENGSIDPQMEVFF